MLGFAGGGGFAGEGGFAGGGGFAGSASFGGMRGPVADFPALVADALTCAPCLLVSGAVPRACAARWEGGGARLVAG